MKAIAKLGLIASVAALSWGAPSAIHRFGDATEERRIETEAFQRKAEMLNPVVKVDTAVGSGSGTIIHSGADGTYVLTNHHVLPPRDGDKRMHIEGRFFEAADRTALPVAMDVEVVADDEGKDLALLRVTDPEFETPYVATPIRAGDRLEQTEPVDVVGAGLGKPVFMTEGLVSLTNVVQPSASAPHIAMLSAPAIFGNSGGAAFVRRDGHYVLAGVPEAIDVAAHFGSIVPVPHIAYAITMGEVRAFLSRTGHGDLIDPAPRPNPIRRTIARWLKS